MRVSNSEECSKSELDLFTVPPTQTAIEEGVWDTIHPHPNFNTGTLRFDIPPTSSQYVSMPDTELYVTARIIKTDPNSFLDIGDKVGPVNNLMHSMFSQVEVLLNYTPVENTNSTYAYRAYFENLLCYNKEAKNTYLQSNLFFKDTSGAFEKYGIVVPDLKINVDANAISIPAPDKTKPLVNNGYIERRTKFVGKSVEMKGKIHCDIFNINKYLLNNVHIQLKFTRSKDTFYLMGDSAEFKVYLDNAYLKVRRETISPAVMYAHALALEKTTAKYPIKRVIVKPFNIPFGSNRATLSHIHQGVMPNRVVFGFVLTEAFDGSIKTNPFNFQHFNVNSLCLKVASKALPYSSPLSFNYEKDQYMDGYNSIYQNIREAGNFIDYWDYANGNAIYAFDLSPDLCSSEHFSLLQDGSLDLDLSFKVAPSFSITAVFYLEFDNIIEITKSRQILFDYKV